MTQSRVPSLGLSPKFWQQRRWSVIVTALVSLTQGGCGPQGDDSPAPAPDTQLGTVKQELYGDTSDCPAIGANIIYFNSSSDGNLWSTESNLAARPAH